MKTTDAIVVRARGKKASGWTRARVSTVLEDAASSFELEVSGTYQAGSTQILIGDQVEIDIGDDDVLIGDVEMVNDREDAESRQVVIQGRSITADLVDCSSPLGTWSGLKLRDLVAALLDGYDLEVGDEAEVLDTIIPRHRTEPGETILDALDRISRELGFLITDDEVGRVVFTRAGAAGKASSPLIFGQNALAASYTADVSQRFRTYEVKGQSIADADVEVAATGGAEDVEVTRHRKLILVPEKSVTKAGARAFARWAAVTRAGKSIAATYTVRGWRQDDGSLWRKNLLVDVYDANRGFNGAELLVVGIDYIEDPESGKTCEIVVAPAAGFELYVPEKPMSGGGRWVDADAAVELGKKQAGK